MPKLNDRYTRELMAALNNSPFPQHLPMKLTTLSMEQSTVELVIDQCHLQPFGIVHGGVFATLIDTATFWAAFIHNPEGDGLVNIDLKLNYLKAAATGRMIARGRLIRRGRTLSYAEASIENEKGELLTHGTSTLMTLPGNGIAFKARKFL